MRVIKKSEFSSDFTVERFFETVAIQKEIDHPHIAKIHELLEDKTNYYLIYQ